MRALADALGTRKADVSIVRGHQGRTKLVEVPESCREVWGILLAT